MQALLEENTSSYRLALQVLVDEKLRELPVLNFKKFQGENKSSLYPCRFVLFVCCLVVCLLDGLQGHR